MVYYHILCMELSPRLTKDVERWIQSFEMRFLYAIGKVMLLGQERNVDMQM